MGAVFSKNCDCWKSERTPAGLWIQRKSFFSASRLSLAFTSMNPFRHWKVIAALCAEIWRSPSFEEIQELFRINDQLSEMFVTRREEKWIPWINNKEHAHALCSTTCLPDSHFKPADCEWRQTHEYYYASTKTEQKILFRLLGFTDFQFGTLPDLQAAQYRGANICHAYV